MSDQTFLNSRTLLIGIDTSGDGDLALAELQADGSLALLVQQSLSPRQQSAELLTKLAQLLEAANATLQDISAIVVVTGPGSFTGLRIGISAVKGLAEAAGIPVIAISSLAVLASPQDVAVVIQAGRGEYYVCRPALDDVDRAESLETDATILAAVAKFPVVIADTVLIGLFPESTTVTVSSMGAFPAISAALSRFHTRDFADIATLDANYVRRPYTDRPPAAQTTP